MVAFIKRRVGVELNAALLDAHCRGSQLNNFKRPREYIFVRQIPRSPVGKLLRRKLTCGSSSATIRSASRPQVASGADRWLPAAPCLCAGRASSRFGRRGRSPWAPEVVADSSPFAHPLGLPRDAAGFACLRSGPRPKVDEDQRGLGRQRTNGAFLEAGEELAAPRVHRRAVSEVAQRADSAIAQAGLQHREAASEVSGCSAASVTTCSI